MTDEYANAEEAMEDMGDFRVEGRHKELVDRGNLMAMKLTDDQKLAAQVSLCILTTTNPRLCDKQKGTLARFKKTYKSNKTELFHVTSSPQLQSNWQQQQVPFYYINGLGVLTQIPGQPKKIPYNQYFTALFQDINCVIIESNKNSQSEYHSIGIYNQEGQFDFVVPVGVGTAISTDIDMGGGNTTQGAGPLLFAMTADISNQGIYGNVGNYFGGYGPFFTGQVINTIVNNNNNNPQGPYVAVLEDQGHGYIFADAPPMAAANPAFMLGAEQPNGAQAAGDDAGKALTGCFLATLKTPPDWAHLPVSGTLVTVIPWSVTIWGYNEGDPYIAFNLSGALTRTNSATANVTMAVIQPPYDDYYRATMSVGPITLEGAGGAGATVVLPNDPAVISTGFRQNITMNISRIYTGENWAHSMVPQVETVFGEIQNNSWLATTQLATNSTPEQYRGGFQTGLQPETDQEWQELVDNGDPYTYITTQLNKEILPLDKGGYVWLRAADESDYNPRQNIDNLTGQRGAYPPGARAANPNLRFRGRGRTFFAHCMLGTTPSGAIGAQQIQLQRDFAGEFATNSQWRHPEIAKIRPEAWTKCAQVLTQLPQLVENPKHNKETLIDSITGALGLSPGTRASLAKWIPLILKTAQEVTPMIASLV